MGPFHRSTTLVKPQDPVDLELRVLSPKGSIQNNSGRRKRGYTFLVIRWILVGLLPLCILASFIRFHIHVESWEELTREREPIDVVSVSLKPSCVTRHAVIALNRYLQPRSIHVVTTNSDKCAIYKTFAPNVACHTQDEFIDGLTVDLVGRYIEQHLGLDQHSQFKGRELSGWYMQQFIKLGSAQALPDLSRYFLVWDLDMVLLSPVRLFWPEQSSPADSEPAPTTFKTLVNIGGSVAPGYISSFRRLMRRNLEFAPDGSSFVAHWMIIYKPFLLEFLQELASNGDGPWAWVWRILDAVDPSHAEVGFSEYASYISWVRQHYPNSQHFASRKTWVRHPFGQTTVKLLRWLRRDHCCCPSSALLALLRFLGYVYTGYEVGHISECRYNELQHQTSYGL